MKPYKSLIFILILLGFCTAYNWYTKSRENIASIEPQEIEHQEVEDFLEESVNLGFEKVSMKDFLDSAILETKVLPLEYSSFDEHPLSAFYNLLLYKNDSVRFKEYLEYFSDEFSSEISPLIRILHYGDSQIEGDRISSSLRFYLQKYFGGNGLGLLPINNSYALANNISAKISTDWDMVEMRKQNRKGSYGIMGAYIAPPTIWNIDPRLRKTIFGSIGFSLKALDRNKIGNRVWVITHGDLVNENIYLSVNGSRLASKPIQTKGIGCKLLSWQIEDSICKNLNSLSLDVKMDHNHRIYAIANNNEGGVCVDNLPYRGSSGDVFMKQNRGFLSENFRLLGVKLIIYSFGSNIIPANLDRNLDTAELNLYKSNLLKEISYLKTISPSTKLIILGLPYRAHPNAIDIRNAQRDIALKTNNIYIDIWDYTYNLPNCYASDNIHLNEHGAEELGKIIYKSLIIDFVKFANNRQDAN